MEPTFHKSSSPIDLNEIASYEPEISQENKDTLFNLMYDYPLNVFLL